MEAIEEEVEARSMEGVEIFFLTDNSVDKAVYYWENSRDKETFELIIRLVFLELMGCFILYIIWVAGTSQIATGIYEFYRGCLTDRISSYVSTLYFVPLNEIIFKRFDTLLL